MSGPSGSQQLRQRPSEDAGSATSANYDFQYHAAARHCCDLLGADDSAWILCEWHTDYVIGHDQRPDVLVSVKHRESQAGPWTLHRLFGNEGKLLTLWSRWEQCGRPPECRFVTNGRLDRAATALAQACRASDHETIARIARVEADRLGCDPEALSAFFAVLRFETGLPGRREIRAVNTDRHMRPALRRLGLDFVDPWSAYDLVVDAVRTASQDDGRQRSGSWSLSAPHALDESQLLPAMIDRRTLDANRLREVLAHATTLPTSLSRPGSNRRWHAPKPGAAVSRPGLMDQLVKALTERTGTTVGVVAAVHGAGGFGKTMLAQQVAQEPRIMGYYSALLWTTLGEDAHGATVAARVNDLTEQLTGQRPGWSDPQQAGMRLIEALEHHHAPVLIVIDDAWHRDQISPFTPITSNCTLLVTTRKRWIVPEGSTTVLIDRMRPNEARQLLTRGAPDVPDSELVDLMRVTGRWPVLMSIADSAMTRLTRYGMTSAQAARHLLDLLEVDGPTALDTTNATSRSDAVAATVGAGMELLPVGALDRYVELAVFPEDSDIPIDLVIALWEATGALSHARAEALCMELADLSLISSLSFEARTFQLHDVLRAFAVHRLGPERVVGLHSTLLTACEYLLVQTHEIKCAADAAPRSWWLLPPTEHYLLNRLARHLVEAGLTAELRALLTDLRWSELRIRTSGIAALVSDLALVDDSATYALRRAIDQSAHLFTAITPQASIGAALASRLGEVPDLAGSVEEFRAGLTGSLLTNRLPLPDLPTSTLVRTVPGIVGGSTEVIVSPDGKAIVTVDVTGVVRFSDPVTGELLRAIPLDPRPDQARFSPDGSQLLVVGDESLQTSWIAVIDTASGNWQWSLKRIWDGTSVWPVVAYSPESSALAAAVVRETENIVDIHILDSMTGESRVIIGQVGDPRSISFSSNGRSLIVGNCLLGETAESVAYIFDVLSGACLRTLEGHSSGPLEARFLLDERLLTVDWSGVARIWTIDGDCAVTIPDLGACPEIVVTPDGRWLASVSNGGNELRVYNLVDGARRFLATAQGRWSMIAASSDSMSIGVYDLDGEGDGSGSTLLIFDVSTGDIQQRIIGPVDSWSAPAFAPDGSWVAGVDGRQSVVKHDDRHVRVWSTGTGGEDAARLAPGLVRDLAVTPGGTWVAQLAADGEVRLSDPSLSGRRITNRRRAEMVAVSADGSRVAVYDGETIILTGSSADCPIIQLAGDIEVVLSMCFSSDGASLLVGQMPHDNGQGISGDHIAAQVWDTRTGCLRFTLPGHTYCVYHSGFSVDGAWFATADGERGWPDNETHVHIWDMATGERRQILSGHRGGVGVLLSGPDGSWVVTGEAPISPAPNCRVLVWDSSNGALIRTLDGHTSSVQAAAISPNGMWLATGDAAGAVRVCSTRTWTPLSAFQTLGEITDLAVSPCGKWLAGTVSSGGSGYLTIWDPYSGTALASMPVDGRLRRCWWLAGSLTLCALGNRGMYAFDWHE